MKRESRRPPDHQPAKKTTTTAEMRETAIPNDALPRSEVLGSHSRSRVVQAALRRVALLRRLAQRVERTEEARRKDDELFALMLGHVGSVFASDEECRAAWVKRREEIMARDWPTGHRPWGWWAFEAERPKHLVSLTEVLDFEGTQDEEAEALDEYKTEPVEWMAAHGHLTAEEIAAITEKANEARPRIGTDSEHIGSGGVDRADQRAVKLYEAITAALAG